MYNDDNLIYCLTILELIEKVEHCVGGFSSEAELMAEDYQVNYMAILQSLLVIGEESKKIDASLRSEFPAVDWANMIRMRNYLAHDYRGVDTKRVYDVATNYMESLKTVLIQMIDRIDYAPQQMRIALDSRYYRHIQYLRTKLPD
jgi:uncharacterized protein with HEPN domain